MDTHAFSTIIESRRSIRQYDPSVVIPQDEIEAILKQAFTAPSTLNMQPIRVAVVASPEGKRKIEPIMAYNHKQWETSSAMFFLFGDVRAQENIEKIMQGAVDAGSMSASVMQQQIDKVTGYYQAYSQQDIENIVRFDGGLLAMNLMLIAKDHGYDTCAIGGFDKQKIHEVLGIDPDRYIPLLAMSIGKAREEGFKSYRLPLNDFTSWY